MKPIALELTPAPTVIEAFRKFQHVPGCLLLDSSMQIQSATNQPLGRFSFLMADPHDWIEIPVGQVAPLKKIREHLRRFQVENIPELPPMQGGIAGLLSYDLLHSFENIAASRIDEFPLPAIAVGCYDAVVAWDHQQQRAWVISSGWPELNEQSRQQKAGDRQRHFANILNSPTKSKSLELEPLPRIPVQHQFGVAGPSGITSSFTADHYLTTVQKCIDYIYAGDVFQINLAQRLLFPANCHAADLYERLRICNPAPFAGYFDLSGGSTHDRRGIQIVSASPERLMGVRDRLVETRPIKGTRRRTGTPIVDIYAKSQLTSSSKDRAENTMIVDLMRNDLSRCCLDESIEVTQLCELEQYQSVLHLVSAVQGRLRPECDLIDLIESVFPGGSITGAPKIRAMEIISKLEPHARGAYCGSLGYFGFDGNADFSILIRTITAAGGWWQVPVGGGIVSQSNPQQEYEETWTKAAAMLRALVP